MTSTYKGKSLTVRIEGASHSDCIRVYIDGIPVGSTFEYYHLLELVFGTGYLNVAEIEVPKKYFKISK